MFITKLSTRLVTPVLIIFLLVGMAAGHEKWGNIDFYNSVAAQLLGAITLILIPVTGGITTKYKSYTTHAVQQSITGNSRYCKLQLLVPTYLFGE
ncbi:MULTISPECIES: hypothetical protein [Candidatus Cardinium]|uniref:hypothetical protein n=1 Tax=Candidatus Cardinium TaxID=273135 RepID=UPI001FAA1FE3|nr:MULTISPECIES: hypothetical protein [Cardinium]